MYQRNLTLLTDLYELTMMQGYFKEKDANETVIFDAFYRSNPDGNAFSICAGLEQVIEYVKNLHFEPEDVDYLRSVGLFDEDFLDYLLHFKFSGDIYAIPEGTVMFPREPIIKVIAPIMEAQLVETAILNIINHQSLIATKTSRIVYAARGDGIMEFGLRRAQGPDAGTYGARAAMIAGCIGTSNVYLAKKWNVTPVGTMAHEWIMCTGQGNHKHNPAYSNWYALDAWVKEYGVLNGIALTDTITTDCFLKDFQLTYSTLFSGVRHDSGDPFAWGEKMIAHYEAQGIDPKRKTLLFSDSLDFARADKLRKTFKDRVTVAFGIGTYIANDTCEEPLNIVMKTTACNGMDVAKISDTPGKEMCKNEEYVDYLTRCIKWRMEHDR